MNLVARLLLETSGFVRPAEQAVAPLQRVKSELAGVAREADRVAVRGGGGGGSGGGGSGAAGNSALILSGVRSSLASSVGMIARLGIPAALAGVAAGSVRAASSAEDAATSLTTLLGSAEAAQRRLAELQQFAKTTPFELSEVVKASRVLETLTGGALATGDGLRMVGDVAANVQQPIQELAMWFGRLYDGLQTGRPVGEAMMRLQELGVISGDTRARLEELQGQGKRGAEVWTVAAESFARFAGEMERRSATVSGRASNLKDAFAGLGREVGGTVLPIVNQELKRTTSLLEGMTGYLGMVKDYWLDAFGGVSAGRMAALFPSPAGGAKPAPGPRGMETDIRKSLTSFFGPIDEIGEASRVLRESFGQFRALNLERVLRDPFASDAMRRRALDAQARDAFRAGGLADQVAPGIVAVPGGVDATLARVKAELELIEAMKIEGRLTTDAAEKAQRLQDVFKQLVDLSTQMEGIKLRGVQKRLGDFFGEMDGTTRRPGAEIPGDRLSRIGLLIGAGGPANEHARRTATGVEQLVKIAERNAAIDRGVRERGARIDAALRERAALWE